MILLIAADWFSDVLGGADHIEDVVRDLERQTEMIRVCRERGKLLLRSARKDGAARKSAPVLPMWTRCSSSMEMRRFSASRSSI